MSTTQSERSSASLAGGPSPSPKMFFATMVAYQRTAALKAALDLDLFTAIGDGQDTVHRLTTRVNGSERGVRILCDSLVAIGFLTKAGERYWLTADSAIFLNKNSPAYLGSAARFLTSPSVAGGFTDLATVVRSGRPLADRPLGDGEHPEWPGFARDMAMLSYSVAAQTAELFDAESKMNVLDVAAGHGMFGIAIAQRNRNASIVASDWPSVLEIARENAVRAGVSDRYRLLPGDALEVDFGTGFDAVLIANLLHMWDRATNERFLKKIYAALAPQGRVIVVELASNDDRTSPPVPALFALNMLANTKGGDAYTASEHVTMLKHAEFSNCEVSPLPPTAHTAIIAVKGLVRC